MSRREVLNIWTVGNMSEEALLDGRLKRPAPRARTGRGVMAGDPSGLRNALEPAVEALGYELLHLEFSARGGDRVLRVYIDAPGGIRVDDCEAVSRRLSALPEAGEAIQAAHHLEVSSPGIDRPLVKPEHFRRFTGSRARIVMHAHLPGRRRFTGRLLEAGERGVLLEVDGEHHELAYDDMAAARVEPVF